MAIENIISICQCPNCEGVLFESVKVGCIKKTETGSYANVVDAEVQRCIGCSKILKPARISGPGQNKSIRRSIYERLNDEACVEPSTVRVDFNELIGRKKKLGLQAGGVSGTLTNLGTLRGPRN